MNAQASAYEICTYLTLARFTDASGCYSAASVSAVNTYTGANKTKNGPVAAAFERLKTIHAYGPNDARTRRPKDLGPILFTADEWHTRTGDVLSDDGPRACTTVRYVLPDFGEPHTDRVWFGGNLVTGVGAFDRPLKALKNAGSEAARLLLAIYAMNDMETWGGVPPVGPLSGPWRRYEPTCEDNVLLPRARLIRSKRQGEVASWGGELLKHVASTTEDAWYALAVLESLGLIYEVVLVLNRNSQPAKFSNGVPYGSVPNDAEPLYELGARNHHGFKPEGEEGLGGVTAKTAGDLGASVALPGGKFDGTYAAFVPLGHGAMICGIFRPRFRVANTKNAGVRHTWARIYQSNREAFEFLQNVRAANDLPPASSPFRVDREEREDPDTTPRTLQ